MEGDLVASSKYIGKTGLQQRQRPKPRPEQDFSSLSTLIPNRNPEYIANPELRPSGASLDHWYCSTGEAFESVGEKPMKLVSSDQQASDANIKPSRKTMAHEP